MLQQLEEQLTVEEVAHFRAFVAARNSILLAASEEHLQHAVDAVDAVVANLGNLLISMSLSHVTETVQDVQVAAAVKLLLLLLPRKHTAAVACTNCQRACAKLA